MTCSVSRRQTLWLAAISGISALAPASRPALAKAGAERVARLGVVEDIRLDPLSDANSTSVHIQPYRSWRSLLDHLTLAGHDELDAALLPVGATERPDVGLHLTSAVAGLPFWRQAEPVLVVRRPRHATAVPLQNDAPFFVARSVPDSACDRALQRFLLDVVGVPGRISLLELPPRTLASHFNAGLVDAALLSRDGPMDVVDQSAPDISVYAADGALYGMVPSLVLTVRRSRARHVDQTLDGLVRRLASAPSPALQP